jgi:hypothetical protein
MAQPLALALPPWISTASVHQPKKVDGTIMRTALWLCVACAVTATSLHGDERLRLAVSPAISFAPSTVRVRVRVTPSAENSAVQVVADGPDYYRSSEIGLDGDGAPSTVELSLRDVPSGTYQVVAVLKDGAGRERARVAHEITVMGADDVH